MGQILETSPWLCYKLQLTENKKMKDMKKKGLENISVLASVVAQQCQPARFLRIGKVEEESCLLL